MGYLVRVPKKLEPDMIIVYRHKVCYWRGWKKAKLSHYDATNKCYVIVGALDDEILDANEYIVIRSVSLADDDSNKKSLAKQRAKYRAITVELAARKAGLAD